MPPGYYFTKLTLHLFWLSPTFTLGLYNLPHNHEYAAMSLLYAVSDARVLIFAGMHPRLSVFLDGASHVQVKTTRHLRTQNVVSLALV